MIVSDTFRRDNLVAYGGRGDVCPNLNRFADESSVFDGFYACSFPTVPARADLLTGRVSFTRQGWGPLNSSWSTVAELAGQAGYQTMAITDVPFLLRSGYGYDRGFEDYLWIRGQPDRLHPESAMDVRAQWRQESDHFAPRTMTAAGDWLERRAAVGNRPFFLMVDTWDPHEPFDAPAHYVRKFWPDFDGGDVPYPPYNELDGGGDGRYKLALGRAAYLGKARMVDFWIGYLLDRLESVGLAEDTAVLFLTDHGFYFGEHNYFGKSIGWRIGPVSENVSAVGEMGRSPLYEEVAHIPLIARVPGVARGRVPGLASMPDVAATILDLVGAPPCDESVSVISPDATSLVARRDVVVTSWPMHLPGETTQAVDAASRRFSGFMPITVTSGRWSLLYSHDEGGVELFDLPNDPRQSRNVALDHPEVVHELHGRLVEYLEAARCPDVYLAPRRRVQLEATVD
ncbi:MAG: sulfatase [Actinomycetota bacterium]|nr:sulfatase [Actinomycetota bacterium]